MKKIILSLLPVFMATMAMAHSMCDSVSHSSLERIAASDSLILHMLKDATESLTYQVPRYKLYQTENMYTLIKLDTATGALWMVQYEMNRDSKMITVPIDDTSLLIGNQPYISGRYELYPTKNMYTFMLLDRKWGYTYQVQWSTKPKQRFRRMIRN